MKNTKSGLSLLIIAIIIGVVLIVLALGAAGYFYWQSSMVSTTPTYEIEQTTLEEDVTPTPSLSVDELDQELVEMKVDEQLEELTPSDYSGL